MRLGGGWALLARHLAARRRALAHVAVWSLVESLPALTSGLLIAAALDQGFLARRPVAGLGWLVLLGGTLIVRAFGTRRLYPWLGETVEPLRDALARDLVTAAVAGGDPQTRRPHTARVTQLTEHVQAVRELVAALLRTMREVGFTLLASLVGIATLSPILLLVVTPPLVLALALYAILLRALSARQRSKLLASEAIAEHAGQVLIGLRDVLACGAEGRATAVVGGAIDQEARAGRALARLGAAHSLTIAIGTQLPVLAILLTAPWLIQRQQLSIGVVSGAVIYLTTSLGPALTSFAQVAGSWGLQLAVVLHRLAEAAAPQLASPSAPAAPAGPPRGHDLEICHLTFAYSPHTEPVVRNLDLMLGYGTYLAIVGPSGVGKSTLANLLAGLLHPQHGQVNLNGIPLPQVNDAYLRQVIALLPQEAYLFAGTLRDNLVYLSPGASEGKLDEAVQAVGLRSTVRRLGGYDALIGPDGATLSEGERQLVALARVYLSPAAIVLLDEATCHLDPAAEAVAEQAFAARGGTLVVIAHRISSALRADQILLMDGANPILGTHQSLLVASPLYADLIGHWQPEQRLPVTGPRGHAI